jgi:putative phosphonate catabolism associated alcohol dehydrogenase
MNCKAAVFEEVGKALELRDMDIPDKVEKDAILCKVLLSTICGSDLHTITGKRTEPTPLILGHEIIGEVITLGKDVIYDGFGNKIMEGDRITWTIMSSCGECFFCKKGIPQKCEKLLKYGHTSIDNSNVKSGLLGGFSEYIYILPGTTVYRIPDSIPNEIATPANCTLSTVINAVETIGLNKGDTILIQGAGLLGLNLIALAKTAGAKEIFVTDTIDSRLKLAEKFGADHCINLKTTSDEGFLETVNELTGGYGIDVAIEVCGVKFAVPQAVSALRIGGRYLLAGLVAPGSNLDIDGNQITRKCLTMKGIHNYTPEHLGKALVFLEENWKKFPFDEIVKLTMPLNEINDAVNKASSGEYIRVGISV